MNEEGRRKKAIFFYNLKSGKKQVAAQAEQILEILRRGGYDAVGEVMSFSPDATYDPFNGREDVDLVVVAGGDGSVNHVVNDMKSRGIDAALGVIPAGTANDLAFALGMNRNYLKAAEQIAFGTEERVDCGYVNGLYFVNIFSFGIFTTTSQRTPSQLKHKLGRFAYIIQAFQDLQNLHNIKLRIEADGRHININSLLVLILNGATAGGFRLVHNTNVRDGLLDCLILEDRTLFFSTIAMLRILMGGKPSAVQQIRAKNIQILCNQNEPTDADGERGVDFPLNIECLHRELRIISPAAVNHKV
ncbi:MAG: YegS/Rv2252/BmrU family lipid kinase [Rikenellaceae bacterium]